MKCYGEEGDILKITESTESGVGDSDRGGASREPVVVIREMGWEIVWAFMRALSQIGRKRGSAGEPA